MSKAIDAVPLGSMKPGGSGILEAFDASAHSDGNQLIDRLREIGFAEGLQVELLHESLFGRDPIAVAVDGMTVALRRKEANIIKVSVS